jgi:hypothetical protein
MNIELDGISLIKTGVKEQGGLTEVRSVSNISTSDKRKTVEHKIPGMQGTILQDLGRSAVKISFEGTLQGKNAKSILETIRSKFKQGIPISFHSDVSGAADITRVMIEDLRVFDTAGVQGRFNYFIVLCEHKEPPPEPQTPPSQEEEAKKWAEETAEEAADSINSVTGKVLDKEGKPNEGARVVVTGDEGEYEASTDSDGTYRIENLPPGDYTVKVDIEEYAGIEQKIIIGNGNKKK